MVKNRILVVDDEQAIVDLLHFILTRTGYEVASTGRGNEVAPWPEFHPDLVILDIGLPGLSGLKWFHCLSSWILRFSCSAVMIGMTRSSRVGGRGGGLCLKAVQPQELLLRIEKIIRRTKVEQIIQIGSIMVDIRRRVLEIDGQEITLTPTEFRIIEYLALHAHVPVSAEELLKQVWNAEEWIQGPEMVKVNISRLRKKIEPNPSTPRFLVNRWGFGYLLTDTQEVS